MGGGETKVLSRTDCVQGEVVYGSEKKGDSAGGEQVGVRNTVGLRKGGGGGGVVGFFF